MPGREKITFCDAAIKKVSNDFRSNARDGKNVIILIAALPARRWLPHAPTIASKIAAALNRAQKLQALLMSLLYVIAETLRRV